MRMVHLFSLDAIVRFFFLLGLGLTIWSEINYAVLHQAKELQGFASTVFARAVALKHV